MSDEYILKRDAITAACKGFCHPGVRCPETPCREQTKYLRELPSADVVQVRHGTWLPIVSYNNTYKCSECGRLLVNIADGLNVVAKHYPYCHCGAKMDAHGKCEEGE